MGAPCNKNIVNTMVFESFHIFTDLWFFVDLWLLWRVIWSVFGDLGAILRLVSVRGIDSHFAVDFEGDRQKREHQEGLAQGGGVPKRESKKHHTNPKSENDGLDTLNGLKARWRIYMYIYICIFMMFVVGVVLPAPPERDILGCVHFCCYE